ncbi:MAG: T9SS type A sorting domain-containing protein [Bacteroidales bacterium]|nr:T9SS type A sorting domain-containing protein [Bacteroidales bacterium]
MKKIKLIVAALLLLTSSVNAQITLENTYNVVSSSSSLTTVQLSNSGYKFVLTEPTTFQVKLYNTNHSIWKTINVPTISGFTWLGVYNISEGLFNTDNQVECVACYANHSTTPSQYYTKVIDENGTVIKDIPNRIYAGVRATSSNTFKLIVNDNNNMIRDVYSLPGTSSNLGLPNGGVEGQVGISYPNPTNQFITLPYDLNGTSSTAVLKIYNVNGQIIESFNIDNSFNSILLDVSNYASGTYRYNINVNGVESSSNSFIKQ